MDQIKKIFNFHCLAFILLTQVSCKQAPQVDEKNSHTTKTDTYVFHVGDKPIHAELAILPKESETGLMFRDELKSGTGMLFVFKDATPRKFWMKNTRIPLDIGYFDENGILKEIYAAKPFDKTGRAFEIEKYTICFRTKQKRLSCPRNTNWGSYKFR
jgi:uncharacterized membrane protein (UPF0127 family)